MKRERKGCLQVTVGMRGLWLVVVPSHRFFYSQSSLGLWELRLRKEKHLGCYVIMKVQFVVLIFGAGLKFFIIGKREGFSVQG